MIFFITHTVRSGDYRLQTDMTDHMLDLIQV